MTLAKWKTHATLLGAALLAAQLFSACAGGKPIDVDQGDDDDGATLTTNLSGLIGPSGGFTTESCGAGSGCHAGPGIPVGQVRLGGALQADIYNDLRTRPGVVNTANAAASSVLTKPLVGDPASHVGNELWSATDSSYLSVKAWIEKGAQNN